MKKAISFITAILLIISCAACSAQNDGKGKDTDDNIKESEKQSVTEKPEETEEGETEIPDTKESETSAVTEAPKETESEKVGDDTEKKEEKTEDEKHTKGESVVADSERYFIYRIWNFTITGMPLFKQTVDTVAEDGFNAIKVHIPWSEVEYKSGVFDFSEFDPMIEYVVKTKGLKCAISLDLTRVKYDPIFEDDEFVCERGGEMSVGGVGGNRTMISLSSENIVNRAVEFYVEAVKHYNALYGDDIILYLPAFTQYCETEIMCNHEYDYSDAAVKAFRAYLKKSYASIEEFNQACRRSYSSFDEITPPSCADTDNFGQLWYQFRHSQLKNAIDRLAKGQHEACPGTKMAIQLGSVWDGASYLRGTLGFTELCENIDILWTDDAPSYNHAWSCDYVRSNLPAGIEMAQEIDGPSQTGASQDAYFDQGLTCFEHGCRYVSIANWNATNSTYASYRDVWKEIARIWLGTSTPDVVTVNENSPEIKINLSTIFNSHGAQKYVDSYKSKAKNGAVKITLEDDFLHVLPRRTAASYAFPDDFDTKQGTNGWHYLSGKGSYEEMTYDKSTGRWKGIKEFNLVMRGSVHPDDVETAIMFRSPEAGNASVSFDFMVESGQSDGVKIKIMRGDEQLYPQSGYEKIAGGASLSDKLDDLTLNAGDEIYFVFNKNGNNGYDTTQVKINITFE